MAPLRYAANFAIWQPWIILLRRGERRPTRPWSVSRSANFGSPSPRNRSVPPTKKPVLPATATATRISCSLLVDCQMLALHVWQIDSWISPFSRLAAEGIGYWDYHHSPCDTYRTVTLFILPILNLAKNAILSLQGYCLLTKYRLVTVFWTGPKGIVTIFNTYCTVLFAIKIENGYCDTIRILWLFCPSIFCLVTILRYCDYFALVTISVFYRTETELPYIRNPFLLMVSSSSSYALFVHAIQGDTCL